MLIPILGDFCFNLRLLGPGANAATVRRLQLATLSRRRVVVPKRRGLSGRNDIWAELGRAYVPQNSRSGLPLRTRQTQADPPGPRACSVLPPRSSRASGVCTATAIAVRMLESSNTRNTTTGDSLKTGPLSCISDQRMWCHRRVISFCRRRHWCEYRISQLKEFV